MSPRPQLKPRVTARIIADDPASLVSDATASVPRGCCGQALPHLERSPDVHAIVAAGTLSFPANFTLIIAAMNPCPCGYFSDPRRPCTCAPGVLVATRSGSQLVPQQEDLIALRSLSCAEERMQRGSVLCQDRHDALTTPIPVAPVLARRSNARSQWAASQSWRRIKHTVLK